MAMNGGFAAGLAQGLRNGMSMHEMYQEGQDRRKKRQIDAEMAAAMKGGGSAQSDGVAAGENIGLKDVVASDQAMRDLQAGAGQAMPLSAVSGGSSASEAQAFPVDAGGQSPLMSVMPMGGQPRDASAAGAGLRGEGDFVPGLQMVVEQDRRTMGQAPQKKSAPNSFLSSGDDFGNLADSLTRGYRKALELGEPGRAMELLVQREKVIGQHRDQAFGEAMTKFDTTGDPNAFIPFINRFAPTSMQITGISRRPETGGGQPMYVAAGIDHETGQPFQRPFSTQSMMSMLRTIGDPSAHKAMFAEEAKRYYELEMLRQKTDIETEAKGSLLERSHKLRLGEISAQGEESRRTNAAKGSIDNKTAQPAEVRTANWLIENGVAKDAAGAWDLVRGARAKPREQYILETARMLLKEQDPLAMGGDRLTPQQAVRQSEQLYDTLNGGGRQSSEAGAGPKVGVIEDGYRFKGGDPADPKNWEEL